MTEDIPFQSSYFYPIWFCFMVKQTKKYPSFAKSVQVAPLNFILPTVANCKAHVSIFAFVLKFIYTERI